MSVLINKTLSEYQNDKLYLRLKIKLILLLMSALINKMFSKYQNNKLYLRLKIKLIDEESFKQ